MSMARYQQRTQNQSSKQVEHLAACRTPAMARNVASQAASSIISSRAASGNRRVWLTLAGNKTLGLQEHPELPNPSCGTLSALREDYSNKLKSKRASSADSQVPKPQKISGRSSNLLVNAVTILAGRHPRLHRAGRLRHASTRSKTTGPIPFQYLFRPFVPRRR